MKIALNGSLLSAPLDFEGFLAKAARYGYEGADIGLDQILALDPSDPVGAGLAAFDQYGVQPSAWGLPLDFRNVDSDEGYLASIAEFTGKAKLAADLGCPRMVTWLMPALPDPDLFRRVAGERIKRAAGIAGEYGVRIGLEWVGPYTARQGEGLRPFLWRMDQLLEWIDEMGEANLGLLVDSWHWYHQDGTVAELEALSAAQVVHVHINDAPDRPKDALDDGTDRLLPGEGVINLAGFVGALAQIGYTDYLSPEVLSPAMKELPGDEAVVRAEKGVRELLEAL
jgi:sugar phosphate isomerase/epimerase